MWEPRSIPKIAMQVSNGSARRGQDTDWFLFLLFLVVCLVRYLFPLRCSTSVTIDFFGIVGIIIIAAIIIVNFTLRVGWVIFSRFTCRKFLEPIFEESWPKFVISAMWLSLQIIGKLRKKPFELLWGRPPSSITSTLGWFIGFWGHKGYRWSCSPGCGRFHWGRFLIWFRTSGIYQH